MSLKWCDHHYFEKYTYDWILHVSFIASLVPKFMYVILYYSLKTVKYCKKNFYKCHLPILVKYWNPRLFIQKMVISSYRPFLAHRSHMGQHLAWLLLYRYIWWTSGISATSICITDLPASVHLQMVAMFIDEVQGWYTSITARHWQLIIMEQRWKMSFNIG